MKRIPGNLKIKAYHAITSQKVRQIGNSYKTCLIGGNNCSKAISSHSVSVSALKTIAHDGHVYTFQSPTYDELNNIYATCKYHPKLLGIKKASTYFGFCNIHDDSIFSEIEKIDIYPTNQQVFLFHFRAYSRTLYQNINGDIALREIYNTKIPFGQESIDARLKIASYFKPQEAAFLDLSNNYERMKLCLEAKKNPMLSSIFIRINCIPDVMCSAILSPVYDFEGNFLLPLLIENELDFCQTMSITISKDSMGGFILLSWNDDDILTGSFIKTFIKSGFDFNRLIAIIFGNTENFFFDERWWHSLDDERRNLLMYFASVTFLSIADLSQDHWQLMYRTLVNNQKKYVNWQILSIDQIKG